MNVSTNRPRSIGNYFLDEAGDAFLFDKRGQIIVGSEGCSQFFILGLVVIANRESLWRELEELRAWLLADPYFKKVPSMQPQAKKTALAFHAKDDVPEVRWMVFSFLLERLDELRCYAVIRDKRKLIEHVRQRKEQDASYRYNPNEVYDDLVQCLFHGLLQKHDEYNIYFTSRGRKDRTAALGKELKAAQDMFGNKWGLTTSATINVFPKPREYPGLPVVDYFLWALQRLYERHEDRYVELLWPAFRLVRDLDDTHQTKYGAFYTQKRPLTLAALKDRPRILGI